MWPFKKRLSRDLSEIWEGELEITIEGVGTRIYIFDRDHLATHVAIVVARLTDKSVIVNNIKKAPWEIISFDREAKRLVVRPV